jgi:hypothetical protein
MIRGGLCLDPAIDEDDVDVEAVAAVVDDARSNWGDDDDVDPSLASLPSSLLYVVATPPL